MNITNFCLSCFFWSHLVFLQSMTIDVKHELSSPIKRLQVFSERCSGSNYVTALLIKHFDFENCFTIPERKIPEQLKTIQEPLQFYCFREEDQIVHKLFLYPYGHKHFSPWFDLPSECFLGPKQFYDFENSDDCLFIVVFRNPYDWVRSFYIAPWHAAPEVYARSFEDFIRLPWDTEKSSLDMQVQYKYNPLVDCNPVNRSLFKNIFHLRKSKIKNMLTIKDKVKNIYYVNYEKVQDSPYKFLKELEALYELQLKEPYEDVDSYKGDQFQGPYIKKHYPSITDKDLVYINSELDVLLENSIGYEILTQDSD